MTPHQRAVATRQLDAASLQRDHVVVALSGAHAYGFPSPDSDLDLKAVHVAPTRALLGLHPDLSPIEETTTVEGVELDYSSHELGMVLHGVLKGNGNFIERILGDLLLVRSPLLDQLQPLVRANLSRRVHHHYLGFARNQRREAEATHRAKKVLYVLRTTLTGAHLLGTGALVTDVTRLAPLYGLDLTDILAAKSQAEKAPLDARVYRRAESMMDRAFTMLDAAHAASALPEEPRDAAALDAWLVDVRLQGAGPR